MKRKGWGNLARRVAVGAVEAALDETLDDAVDDVEPVSLARLIDRGADICEELTDTVERASPPDARTAERARRLTRKLGELAAALDDWQEAD